MAMRRKRLRRQRKLLDRGRRSDPTCLTRLTCAVKNQVETLREKGHPHQARNNSSVPNSRL